MGTQGRLRASMLVAQVMAQSLCFCGQLWGSNFQATEKEASLLDW